MDISEIVRRIYFRNEGNVWKDASAFNSNENLVRDSVLWSLFFTSMYPLIDWILKTYFAKGVQHLIEDKNRYKDLIGYLYSLIHHLVVLPFAVLAIYSECMRDDEEWNAVNFAVEYAFLPPYCFGYLMGDFIMYAIPAATKGKMDMLIHHVLGLSMIYAACLTTPPVIFNLILICDSQSYCMIFSAYSSVSNHVIGGCAGRLSDFKYT